MNKRMMARNLSEKWDVPLTTAQDYLNTTLSLIEETLVMGEKVQLQGFGRFESRVSPATRRRNPRTGEMIDVPQKMAVSFSAAPELRSKVNGSSGPEN